MIEDRIKELAREAYTLDAQKFPDWKFNAMSDHLLQDLEGFTQKFAEPARWHVNGHTML